MQTHLVNLLSNICLSWSGLDPAGFSLLSKPLPEVAAAASRDFVDEEARDVTSRILLEVFLNLTDPAEGSQ